MQPISKSIFQKTNKHIFDTVAIREQWPKIVGPMLAGKTFVKKCTGTKLYVSVEHGGWAYQLNMMKRDIVSKVRTHAKVPIEDIKWTQEAVLPQPSNRSTQSVRNKFQTPVQNPADQPLSEILARVDRLRKEIAKS